MAQMNVPGKTVRVDIKGLDPIVVQAERPIITPAMRKAVIERDGAICRGCGRRDLPLTVDHVRPLSGGGVHHISNMRVLCKPCNQAKGALPALEEELATLWPGLKKKVRSTVRNFLAEALRMAEEWWPRMEFSQVCVCDEDTEEDLGLSVVKLWPVPGGACYIGCGGKPKERLLDALVKAARAEIDRNEEVEREKGEGQPWETKRG